MNEGRDRDLDPIADHWITNWEQQVIDELETEPDLQQEIQKEKDLVAQKLWLSFQNAATAIAQLYKDRQQGVSLWVPFQTSAGAVTTLYRDSVDAHRLSLELGSQWGYQRRTRDILAWAKKRRQHIRREDLISFLTGKQPPPSSHARPCVSPHRPNSHGWMDHRNASNHPRLPATEVCAAPQDAKEDLETFKEAIALSSLNGAMSNISVGYRPHGGAAPGSPTLGSSRRRNGLAELNAFICEEFSRNYDGSRKRSSSSSDIIVDSPTHKRSRLT